MTKPRTKERLFRRGFQSEIWPDGLTTHLARSGRCERWGMFAVSIGYGLHSRDLMFNRPPFERRLWLCVWKTEVASFAEFDLRTRSTDASRQLVWDLLADLLCHQEVVRVWPEEILVILLVANSSVHLDKTYLVETLGLSDAVSTFLLAARTEAGAAPPQ